MVEIGKLVTAILTWGAIGLLLVGLSWLATKTTPFFVREMKAYWVLMKQEWAGLRSEWAELRRLLRK